MAKRFLIRLRFAPVIGRMFDYLPAAAQGAWFLDTASAIPAPVAVPSRGPLGQNRRRNLLEDLGILCLAALAGFLIAGAPLAIFFAILFLTAAATLRLQPRGARRGVAR